MHDPTSPCPTIASACVPPFASASGLRRFGWLAAFAAGALPGIFSQTAERERGGGVATALAWQRFVARSHDVLSSLNRPEQHDLPAPPAGVTDLTFAEFFGPIGDRGLEYSARLRALDGQRVRLVGYMIREQARAPDLFRLATASLAIDTRRSCATDNAPPSAVHVFVSSNGLRLVPYRPGRLVLVGRLEIGPRVEADGRNSVVRLMLEDDAFAATLANVAAPGDSTAR